MWGMWRESLASNNWFIFVSISIFYVSVFRRLSAGHRFKFHVACSFFLGVDGWIAGKLGGFGRKTFHQSGGKFIRSFSEILNPKSNNLNCQFSHQLPEEKKNNKFPIQSNKYWHKLFDRNNNLPQSENSHQI